MIKGYWKVTAITERDFLVFETTINKYVTDGWGTWTEGEPRTIITKGYRPFNIGAQMSFINWD